ncbi:MAG TPA: hypothetical protein VNL16_03250 [Chloroflexota bacterium]|nr:hypothetical protein [Chloroflexota bacterium]
MTDPPRPNRPRPRPPTPPAPSAEEGRPTARSVPPSGYRVHLEREHGFNVVAEAGWPTEYKRYVLVRGQNGRQRSLAAHRGTFAEAVTHFYYLLHPEQRPRR